MSRQSKVNSKKGKRQDIHAIDFRNQYWVTFNVNLLGLDPYKSFENILAETIGLLLNQTETT